MTAMEGESMVEAHKTVRQTRRRAGLSQRALARRAGIPQPNIAAIELGRRVPSETTVSRLVAAARLRPSEALTLHRQEALRIIEGWRGSKVRIFGSVAAGTDTEDSDLDLLVRFEPGTTIWDVMGAELDLEEALGVRVDVVPDSGESRVLDRARDEAMPL